jgi:hypothetical protein
MAFSVAILVDAGRLFKIVHDHIEIAVIVQVRGHASEANAEMV